MEAITRHFSLDLYVSISNIVILGSSLRPENSETRRQMHSYKIKAKLELALSFVFILSASVQAQTVNTWKTTSTSTAWLVNADWASGHVPTATEIAQFGSWSTAPSDFIAVNFSSAVGGVVSGGVYHLSAIEVAADRERDITIASNNAAVGTFVLSGATLNSTDNVIIRNDSAHLLTFKSPYTANNYTYNIGLANATDNVIRIDGAGGIAIEANISDSGGAQHLSLAGSGSGVLTLSGANTYTGGTTLSGGTLVANNVTGTSATGTGTVTVASGGTLLGNGFIRGNATVESGGRLGPGLVGSVGTLTFDGNLDISGLAAADDGGLLFDLGASSDSIALSTGTLTIGSGLLGLSDFSYTDSGTLATGDYTLFSTSQSISGLLNTGDSTGTFGAYNLSLGFSPDRQNLILSVSAAAIPEPGTWALLIGGVVLGFAVQHRVRRRNAATATS